MQTKDRIARRGFSNLPRRRLGIALSLRRSNGKSITHSVASIAVLATATVLCFGQADEALAHGSNGKTSLEQAAHRAGAQIEKVSPVAGDRSLLSSRSDDAAVSLPTSGDGALTFGMGRTQIGLGLPHAAHGREPQKLTDGKVAFIDPGSAVQVVSERVDAISARALVVLKDSAAPADYRFDLKMPADSRLSLQAKGGVDIVGAQGRILARVAAPWAKDAAGHNVKTFYRIDGTTLVQHVELTEHTRFPVVADPKLTYGWGVYLNLLGVEAKTYSAGLAALMAAGAIAVCTSSKIPVAITRLVKILCSAPVGAGAAWAVLKNLDQLIKSIPMNNGTCYQAKIAPQHSRWRTTKSSNCR